jgi:predicted RNase H-like nuclease (RuvC/YqgF family)
MNELKPEDVMRALECCGQVKFCATCPYLDLNNGLCQEDLQTDALALLREKDADIDVYKARVQAKNYRIEELTQANAELTQTNAEKDAEIERLKKHQDTVSSVCNSAMEHYDALYEQAKDILKADARADAITEFAERLKQCTECMGECTVDNPLAETYSVVREEYIDQIEKEMKGESNDSVSESED